MLIGMKVCFDAGSGVQSTTASSEPASEPATVVHHKIGDSVTVGYWSYRCSSAQWRQSIGSEYSRQYPDASFLVVNLGIRNNDKTASVLPPVKLVDESGRVYDESSKGIFLENSFGMLKSLNPGVTSYGNIVFDVPNGTYSLKLSGGFTSGDSVYIDLP